MKEPRNIGASVRARLSMRSRQTGEDFQVLLLRYAGERFLFRLGRSAQRDEYVLKGAMLFVLWGGGANRPTRDLDFTGYGSSDPAQVVAAMRAVCAAPVADDGVVFDGGSLVAEPIRDHTEYRGLRLRFRATLDGARIPMQIDIGFGDRIEPPAVEADYPTLLDAAAPRIRAYPREAVVAEKLHAMVLLGERNTRYKDFYDLHVLAQRFAFEGVRLRRAIAATFEQRRTPIAGVLPVALTPGFYADAARATQWRAYLGRNRLAEVPTDFALLVEALHRFVLPLWTGIVEGADAAMSATWVAGGPWR